jgi:hypothetical protein
MQRNSYHNSTHAADVLHAIYFFISQLDLCSKLSVEDVFACFIAAVIHDVDHPGYNNSFLIATRSPLAIRYNDMSVAFTNMRFWKTIISQKALR